LSTGYTYSALYQEIRTSLSCRAQINKYTVALQVLLSDTFDTFVDDILTGTSSLNAAVLKDKNRMQLRRSG